MSGLPRRADMPLSCRENVENVKIASFTPARYATPRRDNQRKQGRHANRAQFHYVCLRSLCDYRLAVLWTALPSRWGRRSALVQGMHHWQIAGTELAARRRPQIKRPSSQTCSVPPPGLCSLWNCVRCQRQIILTPASGAGYGAVGMPISSLVWHGVEAEWPLWYCREGPCCATYVRG